MAEKNEVTVRRYEQAASLVKVHGILSIIFGGIGAFSGLVMMIVFGFGIASSSNNGDAIGYFLLFAGTILFWLLPHIYLIVSGVTLTRVPDPRVTKILTIVNLVVGAFWNYVILVIAIISLTQLTDYEEGYPSHKS